MNFSARLFATALLCASCASLSFAASLTDDTAYKNQCAKCHGKTAEGRHFGGPSLATTQMSVDDLKSIISNGKGRMPKFTDKLSPDQIEALAKEIKDLSKAPSSK